MTSLQEVQELTLRGPVLLAPNPFVPICLPPSIEILADGWDLARELDAPYPHRVRSVVLLSDSTPGGSRFGPPISVEIPSSTAINAGLPTHMAYIRCTFLQQSAIAGRIADEAQARHYETVVLLIVDGLSYSDLQEWSWPVIPCFVDGPSITRAGYPNVVGQPSLSRRLETVGLWKAIGFSYWDRSNLLTDTLFTGMPLQRVSNFPTLIEQLAQIPLRGTYVQIVREGLDRLAHHRREVALDERQASVRVIAHNCGEIAAQIRAQGLHGAIYVTADHGLLWKAEHRLARLETSDHLHPRYGISPPQKWDHAVPVSFAGQTYYLYYYPYIGAAIPDNDAGVHGGCSYEESFVPFVWIEVTP